MNMKDFRDSLHPGAKMFMDDGTAGSAEEALDKLKGFSVCVVVSDADQSSPDFQACLLTLVNAGTRTFLGGVEVVGLDFDVHAVSPFAQEMLLVEELQRLGARMSDRVHGLAPVIVLGGGAVEARDMAVRPIWKGWSAGVVPADEVPMFFHGECLPTAPVVAAGLALSECFDHLRGQDLMAGQRNVGLNLLSPGECWWNGESFDGTLQLPQSAWVLGVGHLGQAYLWSLVALRYPEGNRARFVLQDFDRVTERNMGTSVLCQPDSIGKRKTRVASEWLELRGFEAPVVERPFGANHQVTSNDPKLMLCGVDNVDARLVVEEVGFKLVLEAGIGAGAKDFAKFRCHAFDGSGRARQVFKREDGNSASVLTDLPAYKELLERSGDKCGVVTVAGSAVGVPFVGAVVGALLVSEAVKVASGGSPSFVSYGSVSEPNSIRHVPFEESKRFLIGGIRTDGPRLI